MRCLSFATILFVLCSCDPLLADELPDIPNIDQRESWAIEQIPANLTVVYMNGLRVAYPVVSSTNFVYEKEFEEKGGLWYFRAPCTSFERIVRPTPIAWRWHDNQDWQPYIRKTYKGDQ